MGKRLSYEELQKIKSLEQHLRFSDSKLKRVIRERNAIQRKLSESNRRSASQLTQKVEVFEALFLENLMNAVNKKDDLIQRLQERSPLTYYRFLSLEILRRISWWKHCGNSNCKYGDDWKRSRKGVEMKICGGCKLIYFCSRRCQKICWNRMNHKYHCLQLRSL